MSDILDIYNVSRETINELKKYETLVKEWNAKFNLISKSTVDKVWDRHILDSLQLCSFFEEKEGVLIDFGSGAGFPGIVIAIVAKEKFPNLKINLVESITKKATFLNVVKESLNLDINIINDRIENIKSLKADFITSRAMASLEKLLNYSKPFCLKSTKLIFPKGEKWKEELEEAKQKWCLNLKTIESQTNKDSCILYISNVRRK